jgi:hypothetical protein
MSTEYEGTRTYFHVFPISNCDAESTTTGATRHNNFFAVVNGTLLLQLLRCCHYFFFPVIVSCCCLKHSSTKTKVKRLRTMGLSLWNLFKVCL